MDEVQQLLGYRFKDASLLVSALTHRSYSSQRHIKSNDRLEFVGDKVLNLFVGEFVYRALPKNSEHVYTKLVHALQGNACLAELSRRTGLAKHFIIHNIQANTVKPFADCMEAIVGAIYFDSGLSEAFRVLAEWFRPELETISEHSTLDERCAVQISGEETIT